MWFLAALSRIISIVAGSGGSMGGVGGVFVVVGSPISSKNLSTSPAGEKVMMSLPIPVPTLRQVWTVPFGTCTNAPTVPGISRSPTTKTNSPCAT